MPVEIEVVPATGSLRKGAGGEAILRCKVTAYPKTTVSWEKFERVVSTDQSGKPSFSEQIVKVESDGRIRSEFREISETVQESSLIIQSLKRSDNATYVCRARNEYHNESEASFALQVLEPPEVIFDRIETLNPRTAVIYWTVAYDGNAPLKRLSLQVKNYSQADSEWMQLDDKIEPEKSVSGSSKKGSGLVSGSYVVSYLAPAMTYGFQLAALNEIGQSEWTTMNATMPGDVPAKISEIHVLAKTNETLLIGWKKPVQENGAFVSQYQMELRDARDILVSDQSMDVDRSSGQTRTNYMYIFVNLESGSHYFFQVRACSALGCGNWSAPRLEALTSDGHADPPQNVKLRCFLDADRTQNYAAVSWDQPGNARGTIVGYNVTLEGHSRYRNELNQTALDHFREAHEVKGNQSLEFRGTIKANTNYTVRVCTLNKSGCGGFSHITTGTMCTSPPAIPGAFPSGLGISLAAPAERTCRKLRASVPRLSERSGLIKCYKLVIIRLPSHADPLLLLPPNPRDLNISTYRDVHAELGNAQVLDERDDAPGSQVVGAYVAEEYNSENLLSDIIIGDDSYSQCNLHEEGRAPRRIKPSEEEAENALPAGKSSAGREAKSAGRSTGAFFDGILAPSTNYSGFLEVQVIGSNGSILSKHSGYFAPVLTGSLPASSSSLSPLSPLFASMSDSATAILFGIICGLALVLLLLLFVLCFLKRKASESLETGPDDERLGLTALLRRTVTGGKNGHIPNSVAANISLSAAHKWIGQPVLVQNLPLLFVERHADSDLLFQAEFEMLPERFADRTCLASELPENISKNRYPDIKSYDQTRVRLPLIDGSPGSDYINADFVEGYRGRKLFICAQGPL